MSSGRQEEAAGAEERENVTAARNEMSGYRSGIAGLPGFGDDFLLRPAGKRPAEESAYAGRNRGMIRACTIF